MASPILFNQILPHPDNTQVSIAVGGSGLVVLNKNSKTPQSDAEQPWNVQAGTDATGANVVIVPTNFASYLDLYHIWGDANNPTASPIVRVWGLLRQVSNSVHDRLMPYDVNQTVFPNAVNWWVPLLDPTPPTGATNAYEIEIGGGPIQSFPSGLTEGGTGIRISAPRKVFCAGVERVMVLVQTEADQTEAGLIAGHFIR